jgi:sigma-B regulation protein RsbU (phosphoserine phosphatase)
MLMIDAQITANQLLRAFHRDEPYLFLGSAFTAVGFVAIGLCVIRRRFDALLVWMGVFAGLYGVRLWLQSQMFDLEFDGNLLFDHMRSAIDFLIPLPGLYFFREAGFLRRGAKVISVTAVVTFPLMFAATLAFGPMKLLYDINNLIVIVMLGILFFGSLGRRSVDRDFAVVRIGILCFAAFALWQNLGVKLVPFYLEPYGFAILLGTLGYVAARRSFKRDVDLAEIHKELELARRMQLSILPGAFPDSTVFHVAAKYVPMAAVAGDLYDFLLSGERQLGLFIADVSGHGIPAALIASMVKMAATSQRDNAAHPAQVLTGMNEALCGNTQGQYVTAAYVHLNAETNEMRYAAAGHPAMLLMRGGRVTEIHENGLLLSASAQSAYSEKTLPLEPGDRLLLYTDGLIEARNGQGTMFGEESLFAAMRNTAGVAVAEAAERIIASVQQWAKSQDDDLTVLVCDYLAPV